MLDTKKTTQLQQYNDKGSNVHRVAWVREVHMLDTEKITQLEQYIQQQKQQCQVAWVQEVYMLDTEKTTQLQQYNDKGTKPEQINHSRWIRIELYRLIRYFKNPWDACSWNLVITIAICLKNEMQKREKVYNIWKGEM